LSIFAQYLGDVGIKTSVRQTEWTNGLEADWNKRNFGIMYSGSGIGPEPNNTAIYFTSDSKFNPQFRDERVDKLYNQGLRELDQSKRAQIYSELAGILNDLSWYMMLWTAPRWYAANKKVKGVKGNLVHHYLAFNNQAEKWSKEG
jgi:ABC-type transport system substrate-binding protein